MEYRRLGKSGLQVSALSFGSWVTFGNQIENNNAKELMVTAYEAGVNFFDNAEVYAKGQSEVVMGNILKSLNWDRDTFLVSSKVFWGGDKPNQKGLMRKHVVEACHAALKRLQVDYLDLFFCHRPDRHTPIEETVWTMHNLIQQGKILYWGTSEWTSQQITEAHLVARQYNLIAPTMEQPQYNMLVRNKMERDYVPVFNNLGLGTTIWSPLASGFLTGKYLNGIPEGSRMSMENLGFLKDRYLDNKEYNEIVTNLKMIADELGISLAKLAIAWCLKNPNVSTVILGATRKEQLVENLESLEASEQIDQTLMDKIDEILNNKPVIPEY